MEHNLNGGGAQQVPGRPPPSLDSRQRVDHFTELDGLKQSQRRRDVRRRIDGLYGADAPPLVAAVQMGDVAFLDLGRVRQHDLAKIARGPCSVDRPPIACPDQLGQQAGVIDMRMGQQDGVDRIRLERQGLVVQRLERLGALEHPAIHQEARAAALHQHARPRDAFRRAVKGEVDAHDARSLSSSVVGTPPPEYEAVNLVWRLDPSESTSPPRRSFH